MVGAVLADILSQGILSADAHNVEPAIRDYRPQDFDQLWKIDQVCFAPGISYSRRELAFYIGQKRAVVLVAELEGKIVGYLVADRDRKGRAHIITLDVLPDARRSRLGSRLMQTAEDRLRLEGCSLIYLEVALNNTAALPFYRRRGYTIVNTIPRYYLDSIDALVMAKQLAPEP